MAKKIQNKGKGKNKKVTFQTPQKEEINTDVNTFNDSCVVKYEVLPPKKIIFMKDSLLYIRFLETTIL